MSLSRSIAVAAVAAVTLLSGCGDDAAKNDPTPAPSVAVSEPTDQESPSDEATTDETTDESTPSDESSPSDENSPSDESSPSDDSSTGSDASGSLTPEATQYFTTFCTAYNEATDTLKGLQQSLPNDAAGAQAAVADGYNKAGSVLVDAANEMEGITDLGFDGSAEWAAKQNEMTRGVGEAYVAGSEEVKAASIVKPEDLAKVIETVEGNASKANPEMTWNFGELPPDVAQGMQSIEACATR